MVDTTDAVHGAGNLPFQRRGVQAKRDAPELYAPGEGDYEMLKGAVVGGGGVGELGLLSKASGGQNENLFANSKTRRCVEESKSSGLRRQRAVPKQCSVQCPVPRRSLGHGHKRRETSKSSSTFCRETVCLRRVGHRGSQRVVGEVRRNAAAILYQTRRKRGSAAAYEKGL